MAIDVLLPTEYSKEGEKKEIPPTVQVAEQTYQEGELWQLNEPATIDKLMGQIPDDSPVQVDATCPFHGCLLEHRRMLDNGFKYVKCP